MKRVGWGLLATVCLAASASVPVQETPGCDVLRDVYLHARADFHLAAASRPAEGDAQILMDRVTVLRRSNAQYRAACPSEAGYVFRALASPPPGDPSLN